VRAAGLNISDSDKLVASAIHGVTPQMIRTLDRPAIRPTKTR